MEEASNHAEVPDVNFSLEELLQANMNLNSEVDGENDDGFVVPPLLDDEEGEIPSAAIPPSQAENLEEDVSMEDNVEKPLKEDREWVKVIYAGAKDHQYSGQSSGSASDIKEEVMNYKFFVEEAITMANVPNDPISHC
jgi:hypothetical protein